MEKHCAKLEKSIAKLCVEKTYSWSAYFSPQQSTVQAIKDSITQHSCIYAIDVFLTRCQGTSQGQGQGQGSKTVGSAGR